MSNGREGNSVEKGALIDIRKPCHGLCKLKIENENEHFTFFILSQGQKAGYYCYDYEKRVLMEKLSKQVLELYMTSHSVFF